MQPKTDADYPKLLSEVIKKQIIILGPDITLAKARNVAELTIADDGTVTNISGDPQVVTQKLIEQFMDLSGMIVKKTMEPLLANFPAIATQTMQNHQNPVTGIKPIEPASYSGQGGTAPLPGQPGPLPNIESQPQQPQNTQADVQNPVQNEIVLETNPNESKKAGI